MVKSVPHDPGKIRSFNEGNFSRISKGNIMTELHTYLAFSFIAITDEQQKIHVHSSVRVKSEYTLHKINMFCIQSLYTLYTKILQKSNFEVMCDKFQVRNRRILLQ